MSYDLGTAHGKIVLDYDSDRAVGRAEKDIDKLERKAKESNGALSKLGSTLSALGQGAKIGLLAGALGQAAISGAALGIQLLGMIPSLVSILSLSSALPAIYVGMAATLGVLKAAFAGVGDAVKLAFDPKKAKEFQEALKELSPEAARFVTAIHDAAPALQQLQKDIQETFFRSSFLADIFPRLVKGLETLRPSILGLASDFGEATRRVANFVASADSIDFINNSIRATRAAFSEVMPAIIPVLAGLRAVGGVGLPLMVRLGEAIGKAGQAFGAWLTRIAETGQLQEWINTAIATLSTLGTIIANIGKILLPILQAAQETGGGLLNTLAGITGEFAEFLNSAEGGEALTSLFSGIMALAKQLAPVLTTLVGVLADALGPAIGEIATTLGPILLDVIEELAPAVAPLAQALVGLLKAVAPLVPPIAALVKILAGVLTVVINNLVAELGPLISIIGDTLLKAFEALSPVIDVMAQGLPLAAQAGAELAAAFAPLAPVVVELAKAIADTFLEVAPDLLSAIQDLIPVFVDFARAMAGELIIALKLLIVILPPLVKLFALLAPYLLQAATFGMRLTTWIIGFIGWVRTALVEIGKFTVALVTGLVNALISAYNGVVSAGAAVIGWFAALPGRILAFLAALPGMLRDLFVGALEGLATVIGTGAGLIVGIFTKLPGRIADAIVTLGPLLWDYITNVWNGFIARTGAGLSAAVSFVAGLPRRIAGALSSLAGTVANIATNAWNSLRSRFVSGVNNATSTAQDLPRRIRNALGNLGGLLINSGIDIMNGLINGINRGISRVLGMVSDLANRVKDAFNNALSIFSPSREFIWSGNMIGEGVIEGIQDKLRAVAQTAQQLASTVIAPTVALPSQAGSSAQQAVSAMATRTAQAAQADSTGRQFGPYNINVGNQTIAQLMIDAITGNPVIVSKSADEGKRTAAWAGSGRTN
jgi:phage-related protein